ncbi:MAG: hypothetical protein IJO43_02210 [Bacilli bacterium]|nr:hypothetical protein [Bacilli bacterium]
MFKNIVVYYNPNKKEYYYKVVKYVDYEIGHKNSYGHEVLLIINVMDIWYPPKVSVKERVLKRTISFLQNILEKK